MGTPLIFQDGDASPTSAAIDQKRAVVREWLRNLGNDHASGICLLADELAQTSKDPYMKIIGMLAGTMMLIAVQEIREEHDCQEAP
jgi:hypothetical protein